MARPLPSLQISMQKLQFLPAPVNLLIVLTVVCSLFTVIAFMCGSGHGEVKIKTRLKGKINKEAIKKVQRNLKSKALLMMSTWKVRDGGEGAEESDNEDGGAIWKKTIIRGERCRSIDFSGRISYDAEGNLLSD